jgi:hypothetical protein
MQGFCLARACILQEKGSDNNEEDRDQLGNRVKKNKVNGRLFLDIGLFRFSLRKKHFEN